MSETGRLPRGADHDV